MLGNDFHLLNTTGTALRHSLKRVSDPWPFVGLKLLFLLLACFPNSHGNAQSDVRNDDPALAPLIYRVEAYAGQPFGIGSMRYRMSAGDEMIDRSGATVLREKNNRVFYPVFSKPAAAKFFNRIMGIKNSVPDSMHTVWFLFRGDEPLELVLDGARSAKKTVQIQFTRDKKYQRMFKNWWRDFNDVSQWQEEWGDYPPLIETYIKAMLSRRLNLPYATQREKKKDPLTKTLELIFDVESLRSQAIKDAMFGYSDTQPATNPLPSGVFWNQADLDAGAFQDVELEPFAQCIPEECFYLRFGTWKNQIWLRRLTDEFGGDLGRMVSLRGFKSRVKSKFLNQLAIESSEFDQLFGGNLISDVAVIGNDMFFEDGSSVGVLLHAKNTKTLKGNLTGKRKKFARAHSDIGCELSDVDINGVAVQFLRTPDNRYRSFYVASGDNHLVTSSISLAKRFIEASAGNKPLAQSVEFRYARQQMPLSRNDTVFVFVPSTLLHNLLSPKYQIELARRNRSITDMQIAELAGLAAKNEGFDIANKQNLINNGFLPDDFGNRPDGSQLTRQEDHWVDSVRGQRGFFVPIPDVELTGVTQQELEWYASRRQFLTDNLSQLDPMFVGIRRYEHEDNIERIVYDARIAPFGQEKYRWLFSMLGEPMDYQINGGPDDVISFQANLRGGSLSRRIPDHQIFGAIQNIESFTPTLEPGSLFQTIESAKSVPGYVGSTPPAGYLDWLPRLGGQPDEFGFTYSRFLGLWRLQWDHFAAISFDQNRLLDLKQKITVAPAERPAQVRIDIGDLGNSGLKDWANAQNYRRSWETSIANIRLVNMLAQQFNLEPDNARSTAEDLLNVELVCSLDGKYELKETGPGRKVWNSTAWPDFSNPQLPEKYTAPLLQWFRGFQLELVQTENQFSVHGFLDIERSGSSKLPSFDLFEGFGKIFGGGKKEDK